jgi:hypothetical protein
MCKEGRKKRSLAAGSPSCVCHGGWVYVSTDAHAANTSQAGYKYRPLNATRAIRVVNHLTYLEYFWINKEND